MRTKSMPVSPELGESPVYVLDRPNDREALDEVGRERLRVSTRAAGVVRHVVVFAQVTRRLAHTRGQAGDIHAAKAGEVSKDRHAPARAASRATATSGCTTQFTYAP